MDIGSLLNSQAFPTGQLLWSPLAFAALAGLAVLLVWLSLAPARPARLMRERMDGYLERDVTLDGEGMAGSIIGRVVAPGFRRLLRFLGSRAPKRGAEATRQLLLQAGEPGHLTVLDFYGLRLLLLVALGGGCFLVARDLPFLTVLRNTALLAAAGYFLPLIWVRHLRNSRKHAILRALPDALDMLTIGVEAGLAFDSALIRVGEKWDNPLTREFRRVVGEVRVGTAREEALQRMSERCGVADLSTFVAVLVQSSQLGVSIADVLHEQAAQVRMKRRQRAEELARQAGVKMVFPLVFLIFPAMFIVAVGPTIPRIANLLSSARFAIP